MHATLWSSYIGVRERAVYHAELINRDTFVVCAVRVKMMPHPSPAMHYLKLQNILGG